MKKCFSVLLAVLLLAGFCATAFAEDAVYTEGYFKYTVEDGSITIIEYFGTETEVTVPASIAGYPVNAVAPGAFAGTGVTKVNLPDTVTAYQSGGSQIEVVFDANTDHPYTMESEPAEPETEDEGDGQTYDEGTVDLEEQEKWDGLRDSSEPETPGEDGASGETPAEPDAESGAPEGEGDAAGEGEKSASGSTAVYAVGGAVVVLAGALFLFRKKNNKDA